MIQQSINQLINTAAVAGRLSPGYEERQEAKSAIGKAKIAQAGLEDISKNLQNPEKQYTATELADIKSRVAEHNRNVYTAKTLGESNKYAKRGASQLPSQKVYSPMLKDIESNLAKREMGLTSEIPSENVEINKKALERLKNKARAKLEQDKQFKELRNIIYHENEEFAKRIPEMGYGGENDDDYFIPFNPKQPITTEKEHNKIMSRARSKLAEKKYIEKYGKNYKNHPEYRKELEDFINDIFSDDNGGK